jgi:hypothetical protein
MRTRERRASDMTGILLIYSMMFPPARRTHYGSAWVSTLTQGVSPSDQKSRSFLLHLKLQPLLAPLEGANVGQSGSDGQVSARRASAARWSAERVGSGRR